MARILTLEGVKSQKNFGGRHDDFRTMEWVGLINNPRVTRHSLPPNNPSIIVPIGYLVILPKLICSVYCRACMTKPNVSWPNIWVCSLIHYYCKLTPYAICPSRNNAWIFSVITNPNNFIMPDSA